MAAVIILAISLLAVIGVGWMLCRTLRRYRGPVSDHFDGKHFFMVGRPFPHGASAIARKLREPFPARW